MNESFEMDKIKLKALKTAVYCPPYKEEDAIALIELNDEFDIEEVKDNIRKSVALLSYNTNYRPLMIEILDILDQNKHEFLIDQQQYISFYWNGILVCRIVIKRENRQKKQLHISIQKYQDSIQKYKKEEDEIRSEKSTQKFMLAAFGGTAFIVGLVFGITLWKWKCQK